VSDTQINAQVPFSAAPGTEVPVVVRNGGQASVPKPLAVLETAPALFRLPSGQALAMGPAGLLSPENPAHPGDTIVLYCVGLGEVTPPVNSGAVVSASPLSHVTRSVTVLTGGMEANAVFAGLTPGAVGLYQVNVTLPEGLQPSERVPIVLRVAGQSSPAAYIPVRPR
jgi:uncharacterized protein (TIGR03437 family)